MVSNGASRFNAATFSLRPVLASARARRSERIVASYVGAIHSEWRAVLSPVGEGVRDRVSDRGWLPVVELGHEGQPEDAAERLEPDGIAEAPQQSRGALLGHHRQRHLPGQLDHPVEQPARSLAAVQR